MLSLDSNELFYVPLEFEKRANILKASEISIQMSVKEISLLSLHHGIKINTVRYCLL